MKLSEFNKAFGLSKILSCKQASIDTWERIEETIALYYDEDIRFETALGSIHYDVTTLLEVLDKRLYDYTFWCEVEKVLANINKED